MVRERFAERRPAMEKWCAFAATCFKTSYPTIPGFRCENGDSWIAEGEPSDVRDRRRERQSYRSTETAPIQPLGTGVIGWQKIPPANNPRPQWRIYMECVAYTCSSCHGRTASASEQPRRAASTRVAFISITRWFDEPRKRSEIS